MTDQALMGIVAASAPADPLPDMPIDAAKITDGNPVARGVVLNQSADKKLSSGLWTCEPGQFDWLHYIAFDSQGNMYTGEVQTGHRIQKFVRLNGAL